MIFVNRKRMHRGKNPSKYWYIEKYVYGELKETLEIPLGTSTTFTAINSGNSNDTFYGWSVSSTSTSRTFTNTEAYSNNTTAVKNKLDSENTLKIYAVYGYTVNSTQSNSVEVIASGSNNEDTVYINYAQKIEFYGYCGNSLVGYLSINNYGGHVTVNDSTSSVHVVSNYHRDPSYEYLAYANVNAGDKIWVMSRFYNRIKFTYQTLVSTTNYRV